MRATETKSTVFKVTLLGVTNIAAGRSVCYFSTQLRATGTELTISMAKTLESSNEADGRSVE